MNMTTELTFDYYRDIEDILRSDLAAAGYSLPSTLSRDEVFEAYFNTAFRRIEPRPRAVECSKELICPSGFEDGLQAIREKAERGLRLQPHQGKEIADPLYSDELLNDWSIHHLHLGTVVEADGFVTRTKPVLFARITQECVYMIQIWDHGAGAGDVWTKQEMIEIIHENWPASIAQFRIKGSLGLKQSLTDREVKKLRNASILTPIETKDHTVYHLSAPRISIRRARDQLEEYLSELERYIADNIGAVTAQAEKQGCPMSAPFTFQLKLFDRCVYVVEKTAKVLFAFRLPALYAPQNRG
jgi:hypothetical protein